MIRPRSDAHCSTFAPQCFSSLSAPALRHFHSVAVCHYRDSHETLIREGSPASQVLILCSGRVKLVAASAEGRIFLLRVAGPGDFLGLAALLQSAVYRVTAETPATILPSQRFDGCRQRLPGGRHRLWIAGKRGHALGALHVFV